MRDTAQPRVLPASLSGILSACALGGSLAVPTDHQRHREHECVAELRAPGQSRLVCATLATSPGGTVVASSIKLRRFLLLTRRVYTHTTRGYCPVQVRVAAITNLAPGKKLTAEALRTRRKSCGPAAECRKHGAMLTTEVRGLRLLLNKELHRERER